ncbi:MAG: PQQ-dependent sugar dehydrogenase [Pseudomonadota bacterium]
MHSHNDEHSHQHPVSNRKSWQIDFQAGTSEIGGVQNAITSSADIGSGDIWNAFTIGPITGPGISVANPSLSNLRSSDGAASDVNVSIAGNVGGFNHGDPVSTANPAYAYEPGNIGSVLGDHLYFGIDDAGNTTSPAFDLNFDNLEPGIYSYAAYISPLGGEDREFTVTINGKQHSVTNQVDPTNPNPSNMVKIEGIVVGEDGKLDIGFSSPVHGQDPSVAGAVLTQEQTGQITYTEIAANMPLPTAMEFLPDSNKAFITLKDGGVLLLDDSIQASSAVPDRIFDIPNIDGNGERGLLNAVVDPDFATNGYTYFMYSGVEGGQTFTTVARFTYSSTTESFDPGSKQLIWKEHAPATSISHQGGGLAIAHEPNGANDPSPYKIYISTGEEFDSNRSQNLSHDDGKVHRVNLTDGSIPSDNPYYDAAEAAQYIPGGSLASGLNAANQLMTVYAYGFRNPFRLTVDEENGNVIVADVGGNTASSREEVNIVEAGGNYGWPGEGVLNQPGLTDPVYDYGRNPAGASISGGIVYQHHHSDPDALPEYFDGAYFYGDWAQKFVNFLTTGQDNAGGYENNQLRGSTEGRPLTFAQGNDGALYYIETAELANDPFTFNGKIIRVSWEDGNTAPTGSISASDPDLENPTAPYTVTFNADVVDAENDALTYLWDFGDGTTSTERDPTHTYSEKGQYRVSLVVEDAQGLQSTFTTSSDVVVGNAPQVTISSLTDGQTFRAGDVITLEGSAFDLEDGQIANADTKWTIVFHHAEHIHPTEITGQPNAAGGLSFTIPSSGHIVSNSEYYSVELAATDSDGITTRQSIDLRPQTATVEIEIPNGATGFTVDGLEVADGEGTFSSLIDFSHTISAPEFYMINGDRYQFLHWADDADNTNHERAIQVRETGIRLEPVYRQIPNEASVLSFDGTGGIAIPTIGIAGDFTVEFRLKFAASDPVSNADSVFSSGNFPNAIDFNFHNGQARLYAGEDQIIADQATQPDIWSHYALVREEGILSLYVDGQLVKTGTGVWNDPLVIDKIGIPSHDIGFLSGELDNFRVWNVARSQSELDAAKSSNVPSDSAGLLRDYRFDENLNSQIATVEPAIAGSGVTFVSGGVPAPTPPPPPSGATVYNDDANAVQYIIGETDNDVFVIHGNSDAFQWEEIDDGGVVVWTGDKHDILYGVENIQFNDQTVSLTSDGNSEDPSDIVRITNSAGVDYVIGTDAREAFVINGNSEDYGWAETDDGGYVIWTGDQHDLLYNVEEIHFNDTVIKLDDGSQGNGGDGTSSVDKIHDTANVVDYVIGTDAREAFVINGNSEDYGWAETDDGGYVIWTGDQHDLLYNVEEIHFDDTVVKLEGGSQGNGGDSTSSVNKIYDTANVVDYAEGTDARDAFVIDGAAEDFGWDSTDDGGVVVWSGENHDILYDIEEIHFNDQQVNVEEYLV